MTAETTTRGPRRLVGPSPAQVRAAIRDVATDGADTDDLQLAATEVVANAHEHGRPPVEVVVRARAGRIEVRVRDRGDGPDVAEPVAPAPLAERGRGRWLAAQLASVHGRRTTSGYEVRLTADDAGAVGAAVGPSARPG